ncbi:MAG: efflux RND transporter periplasmic adaptor subunit [Candidatus Sericytochromatia bacterium]|nr:efflux RND transporter periplasmic adaptor subunit [Candidatus Sericytochromatia bacterium]MEB3221348.1 efflux RND transporter periplasmic adaptor subunit [Candidatus Sericytochromatia bacterium]
MRRSLVVVPLLLGIAAAPLACKAKQEEKPAEVPAVLTVETRPVEARQLPRTLEVTGSVAAWEPMPVIPAANGLRVVAVTAEEGQMVGRGQVLAVLDDATLKAQLDAARARARIAEAQLQKARHPMRLQDLRSTEAALVQAEAAARQAQDAYVRSQALAAEGAVTPMELVGRQAAAEQARAAADQARERLSLAREGSRPEDLAIAEAQADEARATLAQMEALHAQTRVKAPDAGKIIRKDVHLGDASAVGKAMFQMVRLGRLQVEALVPEADLGQVRPGLLARVGSDARPDLQASGVIREVSPAVDLASRQATIRIDIPEASGLRVGMFVRAQLALGQVSALTVPASAVVTKEAGSEVFVLDGSIARSRSVVPGARAGGWVAIAEGLKAGEQVITAGVGFLKDGDKVDVAPPKAASPGKPQPGKATAGS